MCVRWSAETKLQQLRLYPYVEDEDKCCMHMCVSRASPSQADTQCFDLQPLPDHTKEPDIVVMTRGQKSWITHSWSLLTARIIEDHRILGTYSVHNVKRVTLKTWCISLCRLFRVNSRARWTLFRPSHKNQNREIWVNILWWESVVSYLICHLRALQNYLSVPCGVPVPLLQCKSQND